MKIGSCSDISAVKMPEQFSRRGVYCPTNNRASRSIHLSGNGDYAAVEQMIYNMGECGSMYWQAKLFLLLGDALVQMGNTFQARATYQSIADGYTPKTDGIVDEARQRIANL